MSIYEFVLAILVFIASISTLIIMRFISIIVKSITKYLDYRSLYLRNKSEITKAKMDICSIKVEQEKLEYSKLLSTFIKDYTAQISVIKFKTFIDTHDIQKSTNQQYQTIVKEIAEEVKTSISIDDNTILSETALDKLIVDNAIMYIKDLIDKNAYNEPPFDIPNI